MGNCCLKINIFFRSITLKLNSISIILPKYSITASKNVKNETNAIRLAKMLATRLVISGHLVDFG